MKLKLLIAASLFVVNAWARPATDSIPSDIPQSYNPVFKITAKDIEHLPFTNLVEVLNGMFPFLFSDPASLSDYSFLLDGKLLVNANALNAAQIESIEFYPVAFTLTNGSSSRKGTFVITTRKFSGLHLRSQAGITFPSRVSGASDPLVVGVKTRRVREPFINQELSFGHNDNKIQFNSGLSFTRSANPGYESTDPNIKQTSDNSFKRVRFAGLLGYQVTDKLKLTGAMTINGQRNESGYITFADEMNTESRVMFIALQAGMEYRLHPSITNTLNVEYAGASSEFEANGIAYMPPPNSNYFYKSTGETDNRQLALTNSLRGIIGTNNNLQFSWELLLRYYEHKYENHSGTTITDVNGQPIQVSTGQMESKDRSIAVMPRVGLSIARQLFITAGLTYDSWKYSILPSYSSKANLFPYAGVRWRLSQPAGPLSSLVVHSTYGKALMRNNQADVLEPSVTVTMPSGIFISPEKQEAHYTWVSGIDAGFANDKLVFTVNYLDGNIFPFYRMPVPGPVGPGYSYVYFNAETKRSGLSAGLQANIGAGKRLNAKLKGLLFYEEYEVKERSNDQIMLWYNPILNSDVSKQWRGSVHAFINAGNVFVQAIALLRFNDAGWRVASVGGIERDETSNHGLTFLSAGYNFPMKAGKKLSELQVSIQTRNLGTMHRTQSTNYMYPYVGLGINAKL